MPLLDPFAETLGVPPRQLKVSFDLEVGAVEKAPLVMENALATSVPKPGVVK